MASTLINYGAVPIGSSCSCMASTPFYMYIFMDFKINIHIFFLNISRLPNILGSLPINILRLSSDQIGKLTGIHQN